MIRMPRPGPGNGWRQTMASGQAELEADLAHLVLEQQAQRLDQTERQVVGQPAHVVVALDVGGTLAATRLDDVGIERALDEELDGLAVRVGLGDDLARGLFEHPDELAADRLALGLGVGQPGQRVEEPLGRVDDLELDAGRGHEVALDLLRLALAHQAVVDVDAGQPVADGPLHHRGGHRGVDAAGEPADRAPAADLGPDALDLLVDDVDHGPGRAAAGAVVEEVLEHLEAALGVQHLGVELHTVEAGCGVLERGDRRLVGGGRD